MSMVFSHEIKLEVALEPNFSEDRMIADEVEDFMLSALEIVAERLREQYRHLSGRVEVW